MIVDYIDELREQEMAMLEARYGQLLKGKKVLEIGSGTGKQLALLQDMAASAVGIDLEDGTYNEHASDSVRVYDGHTIPYEDDSFDVIFSSNVLEHIAHRDAFQAEIFRVLKPGGHCIHLLPSHYWRFWTSVGTLLVFPLRLVNAILYFFRNGTWKWENSLSRWFDLMIGDRHGEFGNRITEFHHFHPKTWRRYFESQGWIIEEVRPGGLYYEGNSITAHLIGWSPKSRFVQATRNFWWKLRRSASHVLGSACYVYILCSSEEAGGE